MVTVYTGRMTQALPRLVLAPCVLCQRSPSPSVLLDTLSLAAYPIFHPQIFYCPEKGGKWDIADGERTSGDKLEKLQHTLVNQTRAAEDPSRFLCPVYETLFLSRSQPTKLITK